MFKLITLDGRKFVMMYVNKMKTTHTRMLSSKINQLVVLNKHVIFSTSKEIANTIICMCYYRNMFSYV